MQLSKLLVAVNISANASTKTTLKCYAKNSDIHDWRSRPRHVSGHRVPCRGRRVSHLESTLSQHSPPTPPHLTSVSPPTQERHDGGSNGNPRLPHLPAVSQHLYSPSPSLSHSASSDFQPPYFPPPYQPMSYPQSSDHYSHLGDPFNINSIHQSPSSNQQQPWPGRQGQEGLGSHGRSGLASQILGLEGGSSSVRREGFRRPELLPPNAHSIDQSVIGDSMGMHDMGHGLDDVQVGGLFFFIHKK